MDKDRYLSTTIGDSHERRQAIDPSRSFIVQAPAGSGKTAILVQRYLRLLQIVNYPEQIVALTFTRKAAMEMRARIIFALQAAQSELNQSLEQRTYDYAKTALQRSNQLNWQLLQQPGRLRVMTIDSLCQALIVAMPQPEEHIVYAQIAKFPKRHYQMAAKLCITHALADVTLQQPLKILLLHLDNRHDILIDLFSDLLTNREQWLANLYLAKEKNKAHYEQMLQLMTEHELKRFKAATPCQWRQKLCNLARLVAQLENNPDSPRYLLTTWMHFSQLDSRLAACLASLLLTTQNKFRKSFDHHVGLRRAACTAEIYEATYANEELMHNYYDVLKQMAQEMLKDLANEPDFLAALLRVKILPAAHYDHEQWQILQALFTLLPILVAHLQLIFNRANEVDFISVSQQALQALGNEENPTDLTLYLDNHIQHLLVDEFQDTSITHFQLLTKLVQGWQPNDGRTLFVVGDPMQSIYRFRQAEVGLFFKAKQQGIGQIRLTPLVLSCNFRATSTLVDWVNQHFKNIFSKIDDIESGAVAYCHAVAVHNTKLNTQIIAYAYENKEQEAQGVAAIVQAELAVNSYEQIAILVRTRAQLTAIVNKLSALHIPFQGVEIAPLANLAHLRDVWSLTQALLMPANRLAWLALLRSPLIGLALDDLHLIANFAPKKSIYYALANLAKLSTLSADGKLRAEFMYRVLYKALNNRWQQEICDWIYSTLMELHGNVVLNEKQQEDLEQFWQLLEYFCRHGQFPDLEAFAAEFTKLYAQRVCVARLQIMTIHKAKGLEFDCVILPSLGTKAQRNNLPLLRWLKVPRERQEDLLLVSPIKAAYDKQCLLYNYLGKLEAEKESYELQRLLYVAVTRAKQCLYLLDANAQVESGSLRNLLKKQTFLPQNIPTMIAKHSLPLLYRLPTVYFQKPPILPTAQLANNTIDENYNFKRQIGIVAHELIQWINTAHPDAQHKIPWTWVVNHLSRFGLDQNEQKIALANLVEQITRLFNDPIGNWLCQPQAQEHNEYELLIKKNGSIVTKVIDRTFLAQGYRWVVDFKTGSDEECMQINHRVQLNEYAKILAKLYEEPIRCGIFYLASCQWLSWHYQN